MSRFRFIYLIINPSTKRYHSNVKFGTVLATMFIILDYGISTFNHYLTI